MDKRIIDLYRRLHPWRHEPPRLSRPARRARRQHRRRNRPAAACCRTTTPRPQTIPENDPRLVAETVDIPGARRASRAISSSRGAAASCRAVIVIHENRGLNPHIKDVARRMALEGFVALALDYLSPHGRHAGRRGQGARHDRHSSSRPTSSPYGVAAVAFLEAHAGQQRQGRRRRLLLGRRRRSTDLAVAEPDLTAGVAYYGRQPEAEEVPKIKAPLLLHYAGLDERINAGIPAFEAALKQGRQRPTRSTSMRAPTTPSTTTPSAALRQGGGGSRLGAHARVLQEVRALTLPQAGEGILRNPVAST